MTTKAPISRRRESNCWAALIDRPGRIGPLMRGIPAATGARISSAAMATMANQPTLDWPRGRMK